MRGIGRSKPRKDPFDGPHGQLCELIQANEKSGPNGERLPWVTTEEEIICRWEGDMKGGAIKVKKMLQELLEFGRITRKEAGFRVYEFRTCTEEERSASGAAMTSRQLNLPEPPRQTP